MSRGNLVSKVTPLRYWIINTTPDAILIRYTGRFTASSYLLITYNRMDTSVL